MAMFGSPDARGDAPYILEETVMDRSAEIWYVLALVCTPFLYVANESVSRKTIQYTHHQSDTLGPQSSCEMISSIIGQDMYIFIWLVLGPPL